MTKKNNNENAPLMRASMFGHTDTVTALNNFLASLSVSDTAPKSPSSSVLGQTDESPSSSVPDKADESPSSTETQSKQLPKASRFSDWISTLRSWISNLVKKFLSIFSSEKKSPSNLNDKALNAGPGSAVPLPTANVNYEKQVILEPSPDSRGSQETIDSNNNPKNRLS